MNQRVIAMMVALGSVASAPAFADQQCKPVVGSFEAHITTEGCAAPAGLLCTSGRVWGGIQATYFFTMASAVPTTVVAPSSAAVSSILFFTGNSTVSLKDGGQALGIDTGAIDLPLLGGQGGFASMITFSGPVSGQIRLRGELEGDTTSGDYIGTVCSQ